MTPEAVKHATGAAIRHLRLLAKISVDHMGISRDALSKIEKGKSLPNVWTLCVIARSLHFPGLAQLALEIDRRRNLPAIEASEERMLEGGIQLVVHSGHFDAAKTAYFHAKFVELLERSRAKKVLLDFASVECDFSKEQLYDGVMTLKGLLRKNSCCPGAIAVVGNESLDPFAVKVLNDQVCPTRRLKSRQEALTWLRSVRLLRPA